MTKLSKRAEAAAGLMKEGAYWRKALESSFRGGEQFATRLRLPGGGKAAGYGFKTWAELSDAGLLTTRACAPSSTWPTEWVLA